MSWLWTFCQILQEKVEEEAIKEKRDQWTQVQKTSSAKHGSKVKGQKGEMGTGSNPSRQKSIENGAIMKEISSQNNFELLSVPEDQVPLVLEEVEFPQPQNQIREGVKQPVEPALGTHANGHSPTYADMKKRDTYEQF